MFWYAPTKSWRMVVVKAVERKVSIYSSPNLKDWTHLSDFGPAGAVGGVWECPDLFPLAVNGNPRNVKWVMVVSLNPGGIAGGSGTQYFIGDFDGTTFTSDDPATYTPPTGTVLEDFESTSFGALDDDRHRLRRRTDRRQRCPDKNGVSGYLGGQAWRTASTAATPPEAPSPHQTSPSARTTSISWSVAATIRTFPATVLNPSPPSGTVFADFEGDTWGTGWTATGDFTDAGASGRHHR